MDWKIHLAEIDLGDEEKDAISRVLDDKWLTMGDRTVEFERLFAEAHGAKYAVAVSSCTAALHLSLQAVGIGPGDEVLCPSMTFVAPANVILYLSATPVFADITSLEEPTISPDEIRRRISPKTKAIIVTHYGGYPSRIDEIVRIADEHSLAVIEDTAHAPVVRLGEKMLGTFGNTGCFSFYANKNITTAEGGMLITDDPEIAEKARQNRCHGLSKLAHERFTAGTVGYDVVDLGFNYRIDELRAAMGIVQLGRLKQNKPKREKAVRRYIELLDGIDSLVIPFSRYEGDSAYHLFGVVLKGEGVSRDEIINHMREKRVQVSNHYTPIHLFSYYRKRFGTSEGLLPVTEEYGSRQVTLPLYPGLSDSDIEYVADSLKAAIG